MKGQNYVAVATVGLLCLTAAVAGEDDERWVWSTAGGGRNRRQGFVGFRDERSQRLRDDEIYARAGRDREPTTKRPLAGAPLNEEIDDYTDGDEHKNIGTRQYPYIPNNGFNGGQIAGGIGGGFGSGLGGGGFNNYPGIGGHGGGFGGGHSATNGILVGPGGPTGIIGRPPHYFPGGYGQNGLGYPQQQQPGGGVGFGNGIGGGYGPSQGFPLNQQGGQYPGGYYGGGQYPNVAGGGAGVGGGQYPTIGNQYGGAQYPSLNGQYPGQYHGNRPIFTEGYGLFTNGYHQPQPGGGIGGGFPPFGGFNPGFGGGFDEQQNPTKNKLQIEDKSAVAESRNSVESRAAVDDKIIRNAKKST